MLFYFTFHSSKRPYAVKHFRLPLDGFALKCLEWLRIFRTALRPQSETGVGQPFSSPGPWLDFRADSHIPQGLESGRVASAVATSCPLILPQSRPGNRVAHALGKEFA
jgi:hypothetical protein